MATKKRNDLTLARKFEVIKTAEKKLAEMFGCGKIQVSVILRNKERIKELYAANASSQRCQTSKRFRESQYSELNEALYSWYLLAVSKKIFPDGTHLTDQAKQIAARLSLNNLKASNG